MSRLPVSSSLLCAQYQFQVMELMLSVDNSGEWDKENPWVKRGEDGKFASNASVAVKAIQDFVNNLGTQVQSQVNSFSTQLKRAQTNLAEQFKEQPILHDAILGDMDSVIDAVPALGEIQRLVTLSRVELEKLGENKILKAVGNGIKASLPIAGAIALAVVPELAIGMLLNESLVTVAASLGIGQITSFAVRQNAEKLNIKDERMLAVVDIVAGLAANSVAKMGFSALRKTLKGKLISESLSVQQGAGQVQITEKIRREVERLKNNEPTGIRSIFASNTFRPKSSVTAEQALLRVKGQMWKSEFVEVRSPKDVEDCIRVLNGFFKLEKKVGKLPESAATDFSQSQWLGYLISQYGLGLHVPYPGIEKGIEEIAKNVAKKNAKNGSSVRLIRDSRGVTQAIAEVEIKKDSLYVDLLTTSPWNYFKDHPDYVRGAGSSIMEGFVRESLRAGKEGRVTLSAVPRARTFYEQIGFRYNSPAQKAAAIANDDLFEMTLEPEQALRFVQARTNIRNLVQKLDKPVQASATSDEDLRWIERVAMSEESTPWQLGAEKPPSLGVVKHLI